MISLVLFTASTNTVPILAENRADLDIKNNKGLTPLSLALWLSELPTEKCNIIRSLINFRTQHFYCYLKSPQFG